MCVPVHVYVLCACVSNGVECWSPECIVFVNLIEHQNSRRAIETKATEKVWTNDGCERISYLLHLIRWQQSKSTTFSQTNRATFSNNSKTTWVIVDMHCLAFTFLCLLQRATRRRRFSKLIYLRKEKKMYSPPKTNSNSSHCYFLLRTQK